MDSTFSAFASFELAVYVDGVAAVFGSAAGFVPMSGAREQVSETLGAALAPFGIAVFGGILLRGDPARDSLHRLKLSLSRLDRDGRLLPPDAPARTRDAAALACASLGLSFFPGLGAENARHAFFANLEEAEILRSSALDAAELGPSSGASAPPSRRPTL